MSPPRQPSSPSRGTHGRYRRQLADESFWPLVAAVARAAAPTMPIEVSQHAWERARDQVDGGELLPTARAVVMRFNTGRVGRAGWRSVLRHALAWEETGGRIETTVRAEEMPHLDLDHLHYAINRAGLELANDGEPPSLGRDRYAHIRRRLIQADRRRARPAGLDELLPTADQLERTVLVLEQEEGEEVEPGALAHWRQRRGGIWLRVLERAGRADLAPAPRGGEPPLPERAGLSFLDAVEAFLEANGCWPSLHKLEAFAAALNIVIVPRDRSRAYGAQLEELIERRRQRGFWSPPTHARHINREFELPADGLPDAPRRDQRRYAVEWTEERCIEVLRQFDQLVEATPGLRPTQKTYNALAPDRGWPSSSRFPRYGGFRTLLRQAQATRD